MLYTVSSKTFLLLLAKQNYPNKEKILHHLIAFWYCIHSCNTDLYIQMLH